MNELIGTGVALVTPFDRSGHLDEQALSVLVNHQINCGINYLVVMGTTGESVTLSKKEKERVLSLVLEENQGRVPVVLGVGGNDTQAVVEAAKSVNADDIAAVLSVCPMYNKPTQSGLKAHFQAVADASNVPVILYNVPGRTASNLLPKTVAELSEHPNIIGIKEASGDLGQAMEVIGLVSSDFLVISGDDHLALPMTLMGGKGVISVIGQAYPSEFSTMIQAGLKGDLSKALALHYPLLPVIELIFDQGNPAGIKCLLAEMGLVQNALRLPLVQVDETLAERIGNFARQFKS
ncbi:MAG: 4-hydroxy-tetrahydrodipicolinate synthase [Flavobacteriaceae bacterium]